MNFFSKHKEEKIFCIGANKTGTTSLEKAFLDFGYNVGNQRKAELLSQDLFKGNTKKLIKYCKEADVFQDVPFSWKSYYKVVDKYFPNSKFILTVRDSSEQWYQSLVRFHSRLFGNGKVPTWKDLKNAKYVYPGWMYECRMQNYGFTEENDPYDKSILIQEYEKRNNEIRDYFKNRPNKMLELNLSNSDAYEKFCLFLNKQPLYNQFPWENKTDNIL